MSVRAGGNAQWEAVSHLPKNLRQAFNSASNIWLLKIYPLGKKEFTGQIFAS